jgi:hypothetical protein
MASQTAVVLRASFAALDCDLAFCWWEEPFRRSPANHHAEVAEPIRLPLEKFFSASDSEEDRLGSTRFAVAFSDTPTRRSKTDKTIPRTVEMLPAGVFIWKI